MNNEDGWNDNPVMKTLNSIDLPEYSENHYFFSYLREKINQAIIYPQDLAEHKITGKIWVKILIDPSGRLLQIIDTSHKQVLLESYVIINLYETLKNQFPKRIRYTKNKNLAFYLNFDFSVSSVQSMPPLHYATSMKNSINFYRRAKIPNFLEELSSDYARYIPPIIPTPVGPILDFARVYTMIKAWPDISPLEKKKQRLYLTKEKLDRILKKTKAKWYKNQSSH